MTDFWMDRRIFLAGLAASGLAACSHGGGSQLLPTGKTATLPTPKSVNPGSITPSPMAQTAILPHSAMASRRPASTNIPLSWKQLPGSATEACAAYDGTLWVLSDSPAGTDKNIWKYDGTTWTNIPGLAKHIAIAPDGTLYAINSSGGIYSYASGSWTAIAGGASSIAVSADNHIYVLSDSGGPDHGIWLWHGGSSWTQMQGGAVSLYPQIDETNYDSGTITSNGLYMVNAAGSIYHMNNDNVFVQIPGSASCVAAGIGGLMVLGYPANSGGTNLYWYNFAQADWTEQTGLGTHLSFNDGTLYVIGTSGGIYSAPAAVPVPLTIDITQSGVDPNYPVYAYIVGGYLKNGNQDDFIPVWIDGSGTPHVMNVSDATSGNLANAAGTFSNTNPNNAATVVTGGDIARIQATYPSAWADYSIHVTPTTPLVIDISKLSPAYLPGLGSGAAAFSGRLYLSVGIPKLPFTPTSSTGPANGFSQPTLFGTTGAAALLFDWIEFSLDSNFQFNANITQVNGIGLFLTMNAAPGGSLQGAYNVSRTSLFNTLDALGSGFGGCTVPVSAPSAFPAQANGQLRVAAPATMLSGANPPSGLTTYFDTAISDAYAAWVTTPLCCYDVTNTTADFYLTGLAASATGPLNFYATKMTGLTPAIALGLTPVATVTGSGGGMLLSNDVINGYEPGPGAPPLYEGNVLKVLSAAFNRGTATILVNDGTNNYYDLRNDAATCSPAASKNYTTGTYNLYASAVHGASTNGLAYAFAFDDVCSDNPSVDTQPTSSITITLGAM